MNFFKGRYIKKFFEILFYRILCTIEYRSSWFFDRISWRELFDPFLFWEISRPHFFTIVFSPKITDSWAWVYAGRGSMGDSLPFIWTFFFFKWFNIICNHKKKKMIIIKTIRFCASRIKFTPHQPIQRPIGLATAPVRVHRNIIIVISKLFYRCEWRLSRADANLRHTGTQWWRVRNQYGTPRTSASFYSYFLVFFFFNQKTIVVSHVIYTGSGDDGFILFPLPPPQDTDAPGNTVDDTYACVIPCRRCLCLFFGFVSPTQVQVPWNLSVHSGFGFR